MRELCTWLGLALGAIGGIVAACHNEVPGPQLPLPHRELPPQGDKPAPVMPRPIVTLDGSILPTSVTQTQPVFAATGADAGTDAD